MTSRQTKLERLRWIADITVDALRLQHRRITTGQSEPRHDVDFYVVSLYKLREIAHLAGTLGNDEAKVVGDAIETRFPQLRDIRNWWSHPTKDIDQMVWFTDGVYGMQPGGVGGWAAVTVEDHHEVEHFYERLCAALGPLPD